MPTTFLQVADNARTRAASDSLNNTTATITLNGIDTSSLPAYTTGYIVTIWDDTTYPDPTDDPNMEKALVTAANTGTLTLSRSAPQLHAGTPRIALLALAKHISDVNSAVNTLETNSATTAALNAGLATKANTSHSHSESDITGLAADLAAKQGTLTLTTTGTSGAATFNGSTLNIPVYPINSADMVLSAVQTVTGAKTFNAGTLLDKGNTIHNVLAYGATGNGSTNDAAAIQAAIDAANTAGGGTVFFPAKTYAITSTVTVKSNVELAGTPDTIWLINANVNGFDMKNSARISGGMLVVNATTFTAAAVTFDGINQFRDNRTSITGTYIYNWSGVVGGTGVKLSASTTNGFVQFVNIQNVHIREFATGLSLTATNPGTGNAWVNGNRFDNLTIDKCTDMIVCTSAGALPNEVAGNLFTNLQIQPATTSQRMIVASGEGNQFSGMLWDVGTIAYAGSLVEFATASKLNRVAVAYMPEARVTNSGASSNTVIDPMLTGFALPLDGSKAMTGGLNTTTIGVKPSSGNGYQSIESANTANRSSLDLIGHNASNNNDTLTVGIRTDNPDAYASVYDASTTTFHEFFKFNYLNDDLRLPNTSPNTNGTLTLGTSALYWASAYITIWNGNSTAKIDATAAGILSVTGDLRMVAAGTNAASVVTNSGTQTLSNKTISGSSNTITNLGLSALSATGTPSSTTYLRGDNTWATVAGGGLSAVFSSFQAIGTARTAFGTGRWYIANQVSATTWTAQIPQDGMTYYSPYYCPRNMTIGQLGMNIVAADASGAVRCGIYTNVSATDTYPSTLITGSDTGSLSTSVTGFKSAAVNINLTAGNLYWFAFSVTNSGSLQVSGPNTVTVYGLLGNASGSSVPCSSWYRNWEGSAAASLSTSAPTTANIYSGVSGAPIFTVTA